MKRFLSLVSSFLVVLLIFTGLPVVSTAQDLASTAAETQASPTPEESAPPTTEADLPTEVQTLFPTTTETAPSTPPVDGQTQRDTLTVQLKIPDGYEPPEGMTSPQLKDVRGHIFNSETGDTFETRSASDGKLHFTDIPHGSYYLLVGNAGGSDLVGGVYQQGALVSFLSATSPEVIVVDGQSPQLNVEFRKGAILRGTVVDSDGQPVVGASVTREESFPATPTLTDDEGRFVLGLGDGSHLIRVKAPAGSDFLSGYWVSHDEPLSPDPYSAGQIQVSDAELETSLPEITVRLQQGEMIAGTVVDATGNPVVGATVSVAGETHSTTTDQLGEYQLKGLRPGQYVLHIKANNRHLQSGYANSSGTVSNEYYQVRQFIIEPDISHNGVDIRLPSGGAIEGTITGLPSDVRGTVNIWDTSTYRYYPGVSLTQDGTFMFEGIAPGTYNVNATLYKSDGQIEHYTEQVQVQVIEATTVEVNLEAIEGGRITGRLLDADGNPKPGVIVRASSLEMSRSVRVGADGEFNIRGLKAGDYTLSYSDPRTQQILVRNIQVEMSETVDLGDVVLPRGENVEVLFTDRQSSPIAGVEFWVYAMDFSYHVDGVSDDAGAATLTDLPPGRYRIYASQGGNGWHFQEFEVGEGGTTLEIELARLHNVSFTVLLDGQPAPDRPVLFYTLEGEEIAYATSDSSGFVSLDLPDGEYEAVLSSTQAYYGQNWAHYPRQRITITPGQEDQLLDFGRDYRISTTVVNTNNQPQRNIPVWLDRDGSRLELRTDSNGRVDIDALTPGDYILSARIEGEQIYYGGGASPDDATVITLSEEVPRFTALLAPELGDFSRIEGRVTDPDGHPVVGAEVILELQNEDSEFLYYKSVNTDNDGNFLLLIPEEGSYVLTVFTYGSRSTLAPQVLRGELVLGSTENLEITLTTGEPLTGTVWGGTAADPLGSQEPIPLDGVRVGWSGYPYREGITTADGTFSIPGLSADMIAQGGGYAYDTGYYFGAPLDKESHEAVLELGGKIEVLTQLEGITHTEYVEYVLHSLDDQGQWSYFDSYPSPGDSDFVESHLLHAGNYELEIYAPGWAPMTVPVTVKPGETVRLDPISLTLSASVNGTVSVKGIPLADATIRVTENNGRPIETSSDNSGRFQLHELPPGALTVEALWEDQVIATGSVEVESGGATNLDLEADTEIITSLVRYQLIAPDPADGQFSGRVRTDVTPRVGDRFGPVGQFVNLAGDVTFSVFNDPRFLPGYLLEDGTLREMTEQHPITIVPGETYLDLEVTLTAPATLSGVVFDHEGEPVVGAMVSTGATNAFTDDHGEYRLENVWPGDRTVRVETMQGPLSEVSVAAVTAGENRTVDIEFVPWGEFELRVINIDGQPVHGAKVTMRSFTGTGLNFTADANGRVVVPNLPNEPFTVYVEDGSRSIPGYFGGGTDPASAQTVLVPPGESRTAEYTLTYTSDVKVDLNIEDDLYPGEILGLQLLDAETQAILDYRNSVNTSGEYSFDRVPPGNYLVKVWGDKFPAVYTTESGQTRNIAEATPIVVRGEGATFTRNISMTRDWVQSAIEISQSPAEYAYGETQSLDVRVATSGEATESEVEIGLWVDGELVSSTWIPINRTQTGVFELPVLDAGRHEIELRTTTVGNIEGTSSTFNVNVSQGTSEVGVWVSSPVTYGETIAVEVTASAGDVELDETPVVVSFDGQSKNLVLSDGWARIEFPSPAAVGDYEVQVALDETSNWTGASVDRSVSVKPLQLSLQASVDKPEYEYSDEIVLKVTRDTHIVEPIGNLVLLDGERELATIPIAESEFTVKARNIGGGTRALTVRYSGDERFALTEIPVPVKIAGEPTRTTVVDTPESVSHGAPFDMTVRVDAEDLTPAGRVVVSSGRFSATAELVDGVAIIEFPSGLQPGDHDLTVAYVPRSPHLESMAELQRIRVDRAATTAQIDSAGTGEFGQYGTLRVTVEGTGTVDSGTVRVLIDGTERAVGEVARGWASITLPRDISSGEYTLTAEYSGSEFHKPSTSEPFLWTVTTGAPIIDASLSTELVPLPAGGGADVSVTATILGDAGHEITYKVNWGDGSAPITGTYTEVLSLNHTYTAPGAYVVRVEADGSHGEHVLKTTAGLRVTVYTDEVLTADGGEAQRVVVGDPVWFDAAASRPSVVIDRVEWDFGDGNTASGWQVSHSYEQPGTYVTTLTVYRGGESAFTSIPVTAVATSLSGGTEVSVTAGGASLSGAQVVYAVPGEEKIQAITDARGVATLHGLPDGEHMLAVWANGYTPANVSVTVVDGAGRAFVELASGDVASTVLEQRRLDYQEIIDAGIDTEAADNMNVYEADIMLHFVPVPEDEEDPVYKVTYGLPRLPGGPYRILRLDCVGYCESDSGSGSGSGGTWNGNTVSPTIEVVEGHPVIQWLVIPMRASWLKEMFEVKMVVTNLAPVDTGFIFKQGQATLDLPSGLSLASMIGAPQSLKKDLDDIGAGKSGTAIWYVRGDREGKYSDVSALYSAVVEPVDVPLSMRAEIATPIKVWGGDALSLTVEVEEDALRWGAYNVTLKMENVTGGDQATDINNLRFGLLERPADAPDNHARFVYAPEQEMEKHVAVLSAGDKPAEQTFTVYAGLGNDQAEFKKMLLDETQSLIKQTGGNVTLRETKLVEVGSKPRYNVSTTVLAGSEGDYDQVRVQWGEDNEATGYRLYSRDLLSDSRSSAWREVAYVPAYVSSGEISTVLDGATLGLGRYITVVADRGETLNSRYNMTAIAPGVAALGDSFSAGEGVPDFVPGTDTDRIVVEKTLSDVGLDALETAASLLLGEIYNISDQGTDNTCHRSVAGSYSEIMYGGQWNDELGELVNVTCSGAVAEDITSPNPRQFNENGQVSYGLGFPKTQREPAQMDAVNSFTEIITLTMGGNDADFATIAGLCVLSNLTCGAGVGVGVYGGDMFAWLEQSANISAADATAVVVEAVTSLETAASLVKCANPFSCMSAVRDVADQLLSSLEDPGRKPTITNVTSGVLRDRLTEKYKALLDKAPNAMIYVGTYPRFSSNEFLNEEELAEQRCQLAAIGGGVFANLDHKNRVALNYFVDEMNISIRKAAELANADTPGGARIQVVEVNEFFEGRELCLNGELNGAAALHPVINPLLSWPGAYDAVSFSFHPNADGHRLYAEAFEKSISESRIPVFDLDVTRESEKVITVPVDSDLVRVGAQARDRAFDLELVSPSGIVYNGDEVGASVVEESGHLKLTVNNPDPGEWTVRVKPESSSFRFFSRAFTASTPDPVYTRISVNTPQRALVVPDAEGSIVDLGGGTYEFRAHGSTGATSYLWQFSDGTNVEGYSVTHIFAEGADVAATLTVESADGLQSHKDVRLVQESVRLVPVGEPEISGSSVTGEVLRATPLEWYPAAESTRIQWLRDGVDIEGATQPEYQLGWSDAGHKISVRVSGSRAGYLDGTAVSREVEVTRVPIDFVDMQVPAGMVFGDSESVAVSLHAGGLPVTEGEVQLRRGDEILGVATPDEQGRVSFELSALGVGPHQLRFVYSRDGITVEGEPFLFSVLPGQTSIGVTLDTDRVLRDELVNVHIDVTGLGVATGDDVEIGLAGQGNDAVILQSLRISESDLTGNGATLTTGVSFTEVSLGLHQLYVSYRGGPNAGASRSGEKAIAVLGRTEISATVEPGVSGMPRTVDIEVLSREASSDPIAGQVTLASAAWDGPITADLESGRVTVPVPARGVGIETIEVSYAGSGVHAPARTSVDSEVLAAETSVDLEVDPAEAVFGQEQVARVEVSSSADAAITGTVEIVPAGPDGEPESAVLGIATLVNGTASIPMTRLNAGSHGVVARFIPDNQEFAPSVSAVRQLSVLPAEPEISVQLLSPQVVVGGLIEGHVSAVGLGQAIPGEVSVSIDGTTVTADETASGWSFVLPTAGLIPVAYEIEVVWTSRSGDFAETRVSVPVMVTPQESSLDASLSHSRIAVGDQTVTLMVNQPLAPEDAVEVRWGRGIDQHTELFLDEFGQLEFELPDLGIGTHRIEVTHAGNPMVVASSAELFLIVDAQPGTVEADSTVSEYGVSVPEVTIGFVGIPDTVVPGGTVTLSLDDGILTEVLKEEPVVAGEFTVELPQLEPGTHEVTVIYSGDDQLAASSTRVSVVVTPTQATLSLDAPDTVSFGAPDSTLSVAVEMPEPGPGLELPLVDGVLTLLVDGSPTATASAPQALFTLPADLAVGAHMVEVTYTGTGLVEIAPSVTSLVVLPAATGIEVDASQQAVFGDTVQGNLRVVSLDNQVDGHVSVWLGDRLLQRMMLENGTATFALDTESIGAGVREMVVRYEGAESFAESSSVFVLDVAKRDATVSAEVVASAVPTSAVSIAVEVTSGPVVATGIVKAVSATGPTVTAFLDEERAVLAIPDSIGVGAYEYVVEYEGTDNINPAVSDPVNFVIDREQPVVPPPLSTDSLGSSSGSYLPWWLAPLGVVAGAAVVVGSSEPARSQIQATIAQVEQQVNVMLQPARAALGQQVNLQVTGLKPNSVNQAYLYSDEIHLGTVIANEEGVATVPVEVPQQIVPGEHRIEVQGAHGVASAWITAAPQSESQTQHSTSGGAAAIPQAEGGLARTGVSLETTLLLAALALLLGTVLIFVARHRNSPTKNVRKK